MSDSVTRILDAAILRPGDTLIVAVPHQATRQQVVELQEGLRGELPDLGNIVVLTAQQLLVYRPGGDE